VLDCGCDKVAINSAAISNPELITEIASRYGSQAVVVAIDARQKDSRWEVYACGGRKPTGLDAQRWAIEAEARGAGEILLTSMDRDGTKSGFDCDLTRTIATSVRIPVIASGGAGDPTHFGDVFQSGAADAALAASVFQFGLESVRAIKEELQRCGVPVRLPC
jgi:imidazole glycerol-phosphate synthase subunit HisF